MKNESKIAACHLSRKAYIYIRQSTDHQVRNHVESKERQYELVDLARKYLWDEESIIVVDDDQGTSAKSTVGRNGFARLVADVALGRVGIIFGIEVSRLARNNGDWYQLLDLCSLARTLIADMDGVYDPSCFNDRLLLGLKGTMSEAELHMLKSRMQQGLYHKARKGELQFHLPVGYQFDENGNISKSPDEQITHIIDLTFKKFFEIGTINSVLKYLLENNLLFPRRRSSTSKIVWVRPYLKAVRDTLLNPLYTGAYVFGRTKVVKELDEHGNIRSRQRPQAMEDWDVLIQNHHEAYITWEEYLRIRQQVENNTAAAKGQAGQVAREGSALLQGLACCGKCGRSMHVNYHGQGPRSYARYVCDTAGRNYAQAHCQSIGGRGIDHAVAEAFLEAVSPASLNVHLQALERIQLEQDVALRPLELQLERARYESDRAYRQYDAVEPENRLVARTLERQWNESLKRVREIEAYLGERRKGLEQRFSKIEIEQIRNLAYDLPAVWNTATNKDRKRLLKAAVEEVLLTRNDADITVKIVWAGGAVTEKMVHLPKPGKERATSLDVVELVRRLAEKFTDDQIARVLIRQGRQTPTGLPYDRHKVANLRRTYGIPRYEEPKDEQPDSYTAQQASQILRVSIPTIHNWLNAGFIKGRQVSKGAPWEILLTDEDIRRLTAQDVPEGWVSLSQASRELGVCKQTVLNLVKSQELEYIHVTKGNKKGLRINVNSTSCRKQVHMFT